LPTAFDKLRAALSPGHNSHVHPITEDGGPAEGGTEIEKASAKRWVESLYRRDSHGRFMPKSGLASQAVAIIPDDPNSRTAAMVDEGFKRGYAAARPYDRRAAARKRLADAKKPDAPIRQHPPSDLVAQVDVARDALERYRRDEISWDEYNRIQREARGAARDIVDRFPEVQRPGFLEGELAGVEQRIAQIEARPRGEARRERKLPNPKGAGDRQAGIDAAKGVKRARRRWMMNHAESMLMTLPPDDPEWEYWQGVVDGGKEQSKFEKPIFGIKGTRDDGYKKGVEMDRTRAERQLEIARGMINDVPEGHPERPYFEGLIAGIEERLARPDARATFRDGEKMAADAGDLDALEALANRQLARIENDALFRTNEPEAFEREKLFWKGALDAIPGEKNKRAVGKLDRQQGYERGVEARADGGDREKLAGRAYERLERGERPDYYAGVLRGLGKPRVRADTGDRGYKMAKATVIEQRRNGGTLMIDVQRAEAELAAAEEAGDRALVNYWAGALDGLLNPLPPRPITGEPDPTDLPARPFSVTGSDAAMRHRMPGDEPYTGNVTGASHLGGGVNTTLVGTVDDNGTERKIIIKPVAGAAGRIFYDAIPGNTDPQRERAAYIIAKRLHPDTPAPHVVVREVDLSPYTNEFGQDYSGPAIVQDFKPGMTVQRAGGGFRQFTDDEKHKVGLLDAVIGNLDRHHGNMMVSPDGKLIPIDHGLALPTKPTHSGNTVAIDYVQGQPITPEEDASLRAMLSPEFAAELLGTGLEEDAIVMLRKRVLVILRQGKVPMRSELGLSSGNDRI
jgi:hypothetical protein